MPGELVTSFYWFAKSVPLGSSDHVLLGALRVLHGGEKHTPSDWRSLLQSLKNLPATSGVKRIG